MHERGKYGAPERVLLDLDATDDPTYGEQEGAYYYHGYYYGEHIYHPLLVFDGETNQLITAVLRALGTPTTLLVAAHSLGLEADRGPLERSLARGGGREIRADAGFFAVPVLYEYCEREGITYTTIGLISNPRLEAIAEPLLERAVREYSEERERGGQRGCVW